MDAILKAGEKLSVSAVFFVAAVLSVGSRSLPAVVDGIIQHVFDRHCIMYLRLVFNTYYNIHTPVCVPYYCTFQNVTPFLYAKALIVDTESFFGRTDSLNQFGCVLFRKFVRIYNRLSVKKIEVT